MSSRKFKVKDVLEVAEEVNILVEIPDGVNAGDEFQFEYNGTSHTITCPDDAGPGDTVEIKLQLFDENDAPPSSQEPVLLGSAKTSDSSTKFKLPSLNLLRTFESNRSVGNQSTDSDNYFHQAVVRVPSGVEPGEKFVTHYDGQTYVVKCPENAEVGEELYVDLHRKLLVDKATILERLATGEEHSTDFGLIDAGELSIKDLEAAIKHRGFWQDIVQDLKEAYNSAPSRVVFVFLVFCILFASITAFGVASVLIGRSDSLFTAEVDLLFYEEGENITNTLTQNDDIVSTVLEIFAYSKDNVVLPYECCDSSLISKWKVVKQGLTTNFIATRDEACAAYTLQLSGENTNISLTTDVNGVPTLIDNWEFDLASSGMDVCEQCENQKAGQEFYDAGQPACIINLQQIDTLTFRIAVNVVLLIVPIIFLYLKIQIFGMKIDTDLERTIIRDEAKCCYRFVGLHHFQELARNLTTNAFMIGFTYLQLSPEGVIFYQGYLPYTLQVMIVSMTVIGLLSSILVSDERTTCLVAIFVIPFHYAYRIVTFNWVCERKSFRRIRLDGYQAINPKLPEKLRRDVVNNMTLIFVAAIGTYAVAENFIVEISTLDEDFNFRLLMESLGQSFLGINPDAIDNLRFDVSPEVGVSSAFVVGSIMVVSFSFIMFIISVLTTTYDLVDVADEKIKDTIEEYFGSDNDPEDQESDETNIGVSI